MIFAGYKWKIVRINGDESVRLLFNDSTVTSVYNTNYNDVAYVGYMYGKIKGSRENNIKNEESSSIKENLDNWYISNIVNNSLESYIADNGFCNDRTLYAGNGYSGWNNFGSYGRYKNNTAKLFCDDSNDLFTLENSSYGNKSLIYPIGLITYDELVFAGNTRNNVNRLNWTFDGQSYWTMSPSIFGANDIASRVWILNSEGYLHEWDWVWALKQLRPVINLKSDVKITGGTGTANDPFVVDTNN